MKYRNFLLFPFRNFSVFSKFPLKKFRNSSKIETRARARRHRSKTIESVLVRQFSDFCIDLTRWMLKKRPKISWTSAKLCRVKKREKVVFVSKNIRRMKFLEFFMVWFTHPLLSKFQKFRNLDENFDILGSFFLVYTVA